jgi:hypothetical protein
VRPVLILPVLCLLAFLSANSWAHRSHFGWTDITQNGQVLEVVHRVHEHDAALLVARITGKPAEIKDLETQARFALYVTEHFFLVTSSQGANAISTKIDLVGAELKGKYILVYQELKLSAPLHQLELDADILMELYDNQIHLVNLHIPGIKQTLEFDRQSATKTLQVRESVTEAEIVTHASSH